MYPFIPTPFGDIPTFTLLAVVGILVMFWGIYNSIDKDKRAEEVAFIFPRVVICGLVGFAFAGITDMLFKYIEYGEMKFYGITFYGGLIGAIISMYVALKFTKSKTQYNITTWFNILIPSFIVFHAFGRIGCFLGGCCYGRYSKSIFALAFPDNEKTGIFHFGQKCLPTQLFEAIALIIILLVVIHSKNRIKTYLVSYAIVRFCLEFLRGDDRGNAISLLSPSQLISVLIILAIVIHKITMSIIKKQKNALKSQ